MTKEDFLASCIVNLVIGEDRDSIYCSYRRDEKGNKIEFVEIAYRFLKDSDDYSSVRIQLTSNGELEIDDIKDDSISKQSAKEFYKQLREKYEQQEKLRLQQAWTKLGVYE